MKSKKIIFFLVILAACTSAMPAGDSEEVIDDFKAVMNDIREQNLPPELIAELEAVLNSKPPSKPADEPDDDESSMPADDSEKSMDQFNAIMNTLNENMPPDEFIDKILAIYKGKLSTEPTDESVNKKPIPPFNTKDESDESNEIVTSVFENNPATEPTAKPEETTTKKLSNPNSKDEIQKIIADSLDNVNLTLVFASTVLAFVVVTVFGLYICIRRR